MITLPDSDQSPTTQGENLQQAKRDDRKLSQWLKIGDGVEDGENSHPIFNGILLIIEGYPDELEETRNDRVENTSQVHSKAPSGIRSAGSHDETNQGSYSS